MALLYLVFSKLRFSFRTLVAFLLNLTFFFFLRFCHKNIRRLPVIHVKLFPWMEAKNPGNIRLDEDVFRLLLQKTSSRRLQDILMKTNIFLSIIRLQDVLIKTNILVLSIRLQDVFKTFSRHLQDVLPKRLQDVSQIRLEDIFKTFWRRIIKLNCFC